MEYRCLYAEASDVPHYTLLEMVTTLVKVVSRILKVGIPLRD